MKSAPARQATVTSVGVSAPGRARMSSFSASSTICKSTPGLVRNRAPASTQCAAVWMSKMVPAPTEFGHAAGEIGDHLRCAGDGHRDFDYGKARLRHGLGGEPRIFR